MLLLAGLHCRSILNPGITELLWPWDGEGLTHKTLFLMLLSTADITNGSQLLSS